MPPPFDLLLGAPGSEVALVLAAVHLQPTDLPLLGGAVRAGVAADPDLALAAPSAIGDRGDGAPAAGTTAAFAAHLSPALPQGRPFAADGEALAGASSPVALGEAVEPAHGLGEGAEEHAHGDSAFTVVGRMAPTGGPWDRALLVPIESVWELHALPVGHAPGDEERVGPPFDPAWFPGTPAILVRGAGLAETYALKDRFTRSDVMGVFPGTVLSGLFGLLRDVREAMSLMAPASQALVAVAVLAGLALLVRVFARSARRGGSCWRWCGATRRGSWALARASGWRWAGAWRRCPRRWSRRAPASW